MRRKSDDSPEVSATSHLPTPPQDVTFGRIGERMDPSMVAPEVRAEEFADDMVDGASNNKIDALKHVPDKHFLDMNQEEPRLLRWAIENKKIVEDAPGAFTPKLPDGAHTSLTKFYNNMSRRVKGNFVLEVADGDFRVRRVRTDISSPVAQFEEFASGTFNEKEAILETAEDDRVIGIPYTIANIGADRYYVINGRVYSGWAMWFGLQAIRSPEDYARNVDITYNVPFIWAGFQLKSQLSLGASFDITQGTEAEETPEEAFVKDRFKNKLNVNINKLSKTSFHLDMYGNSYWHIRRDASGFPDKLTILQPERIKIFLDPKTTKVLYYIYLPPVLAGMALTPYPSIRENPSVLHGPALTYPTPIVLDPYDIIHFKENDFTEYPFGLSACKAMINPATARMDINVLAPMIFKRYAKPLIHWRMDPMQPFQLTKGQIENYIGGMKATLEGMEPMSDPITSTRWSAAPIGAAQGKAELLTILQDLDNQMFGCIGVPESYFKPQQGTDRMISEQDKTLMAAMQMRQEMVGEKIQDQLVKAMIDRYDQLINTQLPEGKQLPPRAWNQYPELQWRETFRQDQVTTIQNTMALLQAGVIDHSRAARRVGEAPPQESAELARQQDLQNITQEVQIKQAELTYLQAQLQIMDTQQVINVGGTAAAQAMMAPPEEGGQGRGAQSGGKSTEGPKKGKGDKEGSRDQGASEAREGQKLRVTFINRTGKKQTEIMKASTLDKVKSGGVAIQSIQPAGTSATAQTPGQKSVKKALG